MGYRRQGGRGEYSSPHRTTGSECSRSDVDPGSVPVGRPVSVEIPPRDERVSGLRTLHGERGTKNKVVRRSNSVPASGARRPDATSSAAWWADAPLQHEDGKR